MYCPKCGKELSDKDTFCPGCGTKIGAGNNPAPSYNGEPKDPPKLVPFILGLILGLIGVLIAVLIYNGNDGQYKSNPTTSALVWSLFGILFWFIVIGLIIGLVVIAGVSSDSTDEIINLFI
jgi:hypothetical protein